MKRLSTFRLLYKLILACLFPVFIGIQLNAQSITSYGFVSSTTTFTALATPTTVSWVGSTDDGISNPVPLGFDFWYMGVHYTEITASTNGWLALGTTMSDYSYNNDLSAGGTPRPVIAPLWDDLDITANTNVTHKTTGTAGSRVFTIQYLNVKWYYQAGGSVISFQVKLYENTGKIEFIYRSEATAVNSPSASIGITATATGSGNFLSVNNAGTSVSSTIEASVTTKPASGRRYAFTSTVPTAPSNLTFSGVTGTTTTLHWTDLSSNETGFAIYRSTDGINYSFISQTAASATSSVQSGLTGSTTYYWKVYAVSAGALSTAVSGSQATSCTGPVIAQHPVNNLTAFYKLEGNANDATNSNNGTFQGGTPAQTTDRFNQVNKAYTFNGTSNFISTANSYVNPSQVSVSIWFKTTTTIGGVLVGFSNAQTGAGNKYDRFIYMTGTGTLYFAVAPGSVKKYISTSASYNDGGWHLATGTVGAGGLRLYVDGDLVASDATVTFAENYNGYWRIGQDNIATWPNEPSSSYFQGTLDDALIYHRELSAAEVGILYKSPEGAGSDAPVCAGSLLHLTATTISGATYAWTGPNGFTSSVQNPTLTYTAAYAGVYEVNVTTPGCATPSIAHVQVVSSTSTGQWTGNVSSDWANANNWCDGVLPSSTTDVIITVTASNMPVINSSVNCRNLTINPGAAVTLNIAGTLNISGTLTNNGTFTNNGTVNFNGTSGQQTFSGVPSFYNITLSNASGLLLPAAITVNNNLTISSGTLNANNFNITIKGNWINNAATTAFTGGTATVTFNGTTAKTIGGSFATTFNNVVIADSGNVVTLNVNAAIAGNLTLSAGTLDLAAFTANRTTAGGTLTVANNATLKIGGTNTFPANYANNTLVVASTVEYSGTNQTVVNQTYGNLKLSSAGGAAVKTFPATPLTIVGNLTSILGNGTALSFTAAANMTVNGNVSLGASTTFNGGSYSHSIGGNWVNNGTFNGNTSTVIFSGAGATVSGSGAQNFNNLTVAASNVTFSTGSITLTGNLATTGSGSFSQVSGGNLLMTGTGKTISGPGISLDNFTVSGSVSTSTSLILTGNLAVSGSFSSTGTITMSGTSKTISGAGAKSFAVLSLSGSVTTNADFSISSGLIVNGSFSASTGTATFTGTSSLSGAANLFNITINGTSLQLSANSILGIANVMTITSGTVNVTSSAPNTVNFNGTGAQNINAITYSNLIVSNGNTKTTTGATTVNNNLTISAGTTLNPSSHTLSIYGDWINNGTFIPATSTVEFLGSAVAYITGATTFNILTNNSTNATRQLFLNDNISAAVVNMTKGIIRTGPNTLTITDTRTGPGFIFGNIQRTHAFTTGVAYAFEGPNNTITFSSVSGVNSITVSVEQGAISDFPFGGSISRVYNITVPTGTYTATLRLHYEDGELNGSNESSMGLWQYNGSSWTTIGKTANSTTSNYVEQSGLTNITNRWTASDNSNVVRWNGSVSSDWNTAANWTIVQGSATAPPSATDIVNLGTAAFTNQPTISSTVNVKNINFGSVQTVVLSMAGGGSLTSGDVSGTWNSNALHTINANNQSITVNGDLNLSDGANGHAIDLNIGSGTVTISGSLLSEGESDISFTGNGILNIAEDFHSGSGVFTAGTGTVVYNGSGDQHVAHMNYNNLTVNKTGGIVVVDSIINLAGNLLISAGELDNSSTINVAGNVAISSGATLQSSYMLHVGGNWANSGTYIGTGAHTIFNGSGTQTITATTFDNLIINKPVGSTAVLTGNVIIDGDLTVTSGTLDIKTFICDRSVPGGSIILDDSATFIVGGNNPPANFTGGSISNSSTVIADGTGPQVIFGDQYGHLILRNAGVKTLVTPITVNGNFTIESGATFNADSSTITLNGNWVNSGTFTPSTSTVICAGIAKTLSGNTTFNRLTATGSYTFLGDMTFNGLLNITSTGSLSADGTILTTLNSDLINSGVLYTLGTTTFTGNFVQTLSLINAVNTVALRVNFNGSVSPVLNSTSVPQFGYLTINNTGGVHPSVGWTILYSLTIGSGATFGGGPSTHNILGAVTNNGTITSSGVLNFIPTSAAPINLGSDFSSIGTVNFGGAGAMTLAGTPGSFHDVVVSNTNPAGISPSSDWSITNNFSVNSGSILNAGNHSSLVGGNISNNGTINSGTSTFTMNGSGTQAIFSLSPFNHLTINKVAGSTILSSDVTVNAVLNFISGKIQTGSNRIIQPSTGTVTGAAQNTGWVNGNLQKNIITGATNKTFEIGDVSNYTPAAIAFANVTTSGDLTANVVATDHPAIGSAVMIANKSVNRYWSLTGSGISFTTAALTMNWVAGDVDAGATAANFRVENYNAPSWVLLPVIAPMATSIQATELTSFGDFAVGEACTESSDFYYPNSFYCSNGGVIVPIVTGTAGTFTSTSGLSLDTVTGSITLTTSTPGPYIVTNSVTSANGCFSSSTASITITSAPVATIHYAGSPYYVNAGKVPVIQTGTTGGSYSSTMGLSIDTITGSVDLPESTPGTYTINYTIYAGAGCGQFQTTTSIIIYPPSIIIGPAPDLGSTANFVLFTANGAVGNAGVSSINGNIGTDMGAISGFGTAIVDGSTHIADSITEQGVVDLLVATNHLDSVVTTSIHSPVLGNGEVLYTGVYTISSAGSASGELILDGQGNPYALFIFKIGGAFTTGDSTKITLINGASACNVFWRSDGAIAMDSLTEMKGTLIATGEISMAAGATLEGRLFSTAGAVSVDAVSASIPVCNVVASWIGAINTDWHNSGNWSFGILPTPAADIMVPSGASYYPVLASDTGFVKSVTIQGGASLTVSDAVLQISDSISNSGTFIAGNGTIELNGATPQFIPALTFAENRIGNLTINNTAGATLGGTLGLVGILLSNGQLNTGGHLTLLSSDTQTALIDGSGTGEVLGNVTIQRYLPSGFGYKYFSSPFQAATVNEFSDDIDLGASFPAFYRYDENLVSSGWVKYSNPADSLVPMQGYAAHLGADTVARNIDITGVVNNNTVIAPVLYNHNLPYTLGFNFVGNPYPSPIDWSIAEGWDRTNIDDAVYYYNASTYDQYTGIYSSYINGISSDEHAGYMIPAMQGFFVHVTNGMYPVTGTLSINNNARINDLHPYFHKPEPTTAPLLRLNAGFADEGPVSDPVVVYFDNKAQSTFDKEMDALKLMNSDERVPSLYVNAPDATTQSICAWPYLKDTTDVIPLGLRTQKTGWITFTSPVIERMPFGWHIYLYDAKTRSRHILDEKLKYRIHLDAGDYENRFFLLFNESQYPDAGGVFNAYAKDGKLHLLIQGIDKEKCDVAITNMLGQSMFRKQFNGNGRYEISSSSFNSGIYIVSFYVKKQAFSQKVYIGN